MADQWHGGQSSSGERWNVNLPAVVGVVFVFLLGVVVWVIVSSGGDDDAIQTGDSGVTTLPAITTTTLATTSPQPMPATTPAAAPVPPTGPATAPPTVPGTPAPTAPPPPPATQPTATQPPDTVATTPAPTTTVAPVGTVGANGDLGVPGHPIARPACDGSYITVIASAVGDQATAASLDSVLDRYAGSNYLRTDQTCPSLTPAVDGKPIYVIYLGPFGVDADACRARSQGPSGAYVRRLSNDLDPTHSVTCA